MVVVYFSGTGNTKHLADTLAKKIDGVSISIEDSNVLNIIKDNNDIVFCFPVYSSSLPEIVYNFIINNEVIWKYKSVFVLTTCGLVPGNANTVAAKLFERYGAKISGSIYFKMPDSIGDVKFIVTMLPQKKTPKVLKKADDKLNELIELIKNQKSPFDSLKSKIGEDKLNITFADRKPVKDPSKCINCGLCTKVCPSKDKCTLCYRCFSQCKQKAITILGKEVLIQYSYPEEKK